MCWYAWVVIVVGDTSRKVDSSVAGVPDIRHNSCGGIMHTVTLREGGTLKLSDGFWIEAEVYDEVLWDSRVWVRHL